MFCICLNLKSSLLFGIYCCCCLQSCIQWPFVVANVCSIHHVGKLFFLFYKVSESYQISRNIVWRFCLESAFCLQRSRVHKYQTCTPGQCWSWSSCDKGCWVNTNTWMKPLWPGQRACDKGSVNITTNIILIAAFVISSCFQHQPYIITSLTSVSLPSP